MSNKVQGPDGKWRSLDGRPLFAAAVSVSERYNTRIEDELRDSARRRVQRASRCSRRVGGRYARSPACRSRSVEDVLEATPRDRAAVPATCWATTEQRHGREPDDGVRTSPLPAGDLDESSGEAARPVACSRWSTPGASEAAAVARTPPISSMQSRQVMLGRDGTAGRPRSRAAGGAGAWMRFRRAAGDVERSPPSGGGAPPVPAVRDRRSGPSSSRQIVAAATAPERSIRIETPRTLAEPVELRRADGESVFVEHGSDPLHHQRDPRRRGADRRRRQATVRCTPDRSRTGRRGSRAERGGRRPLNAAAAGLVRAFCCSGRAGAARARAGGHREDDRDAGGRRRLDVSPGVRSWRWRHQRPPPTCSARSSASTADTLAKFDHDQPAIAPGTMILVDEAGMAGTLMLDRLVAAGRTGRRGGAAAG